MLCDFDNKFTNRRIILMSEVLYKYQRRSKPKREQKCLQNADRGQDNFGISCPIVEE